MVRREGDARLSGRPDKRASTDCAVPAGASPVPASVGAPGSRPQAAGEILLSRAGRRKPARRREPCNGEQARGPQHEVKPAASTEEQPGSRAAHGTVKATSAARVPKRDAGPGGVLGAARVQGAVRDTRGPSAQPESGQGVSYKPKAKTSVAQRESEGIVVPKSEARASLANVATNNAAGGKGPCGGQAGEAGKREGMAGKGLDARVLLEPRSSPPARNRPLPGAALLEQGGRVMLRPERPPVSRVREIRTHGLNGGLARAPAARREGK